ncbi:MAG TPA: hypothetical protein VFM37_04525 [Pseudonocardiaceae bacterium]|nr:hypothetical protein [Pseudonocardiaceae bacterium]
MSHHHRPAGAVPNDRSSARCRFRNDSRLTPDRPALERDEHRSEPGEPAERAEEQLEQPALPTSAGRDRGWAAAQPVGLPGPASRAAR